MSHKVSYNCTCVYLLPYRVHLLVYRSCAICKAWQLISRCVRRRRIDCDRIIIDPVQSGVYHSEPSTQVKNMERKKVKHRRTIFQYKPVCVIQKQTKKWKIQIHLHNIEANTKYGTMQALKEAASKIINDIFHKVGDIKN